MNIKLLSIELEVNPETDVEIVIKYGKVLEQEDFKELKEQMEDLKEKIVKVINQELGE